MTWLDGPLGALDTETTGTDPETARVVTACVGMSMAPGQWSPMEWRLNPGVPIPAGAAAVHGITDADVTDWSAPADALAEIRGRLVNAATYEVPIVGHNLAYDLTLLDREFRRHLGAELPVGLLVLDTLVLSRRFDLTTGGRRLEQLAARHGITFPAHDATADALASLRLLHILAERQHGAGPVQCLFSRPGQAQTAGGAVQQAGGDADAEGHGCNDEMTK